MLGPPDTGATRDRGGPAFLEGASRPLRLPSPGSGPERLLSGDTDRSRSLRSLRFRSMSPISGRLRHLGVAEDRDHEKEKPPGNRDCDTRPGNEGGQDWVGEGRKSSGE